MKNIIFSSIVLISVFFNADVFSQTINDQKRLGLPGDNLDLYAVLTLFQKSKTIEEFERSLNEQKTGINNLDLDLDKKVDFIKVVTKKDGSEFTFILQDAVSKKETQDVAVILVDKDIKGVVNLQIVGDEDLYGKDYIIEPKPPGIANSVTANPAYTGLDPVTADAPATTVVAVESTPIIQYVYSPAYVPYVPPYYYGFYPPYFAAFSVIAMGVYWHNNFYFHGGYYGGHFGGGNVVIINNRNHYNNYHNNKMRSTSVARNNAGGRYNNRPNSGANRPSTLPARGSNRPSSGTSRPSGGGLNRPSTLPSTSNSLQSRPNRISPSSSHVSSPGFSQGRTRGGAGGGFNGGGAMRGGGGGGRRR